MLVCLSGSSDAARVRARAREMKGPRWPRYWRKRGRIEIARRLTKIENSKRSIISRARVATDCAGASTPNHVLRHAARPHARCGYFDVPNALGDGRAKDRVDRVVGSNARASLRKPSCSLIDVELLRVGRRGEWAVHGRGDIRVGRYIGYKGGVRI